MREEEEFVHGALLADVVGTRPLQQAALAQGFQHLAVATRYQQQCKLRTLMLPDLLQIRLELAALKTQPIE